MVGALRAPFPLPAVFCGGHPRTPVPRNPPMRASLAKGVPLLARGASLAEGGFFYWRSESATLLMGWRVAANH
jgi:hypothetical protein